MVNRSGGVGFRKFLNFFDGVAGMDMLRAIPVEGLDIDDDSPLRFSAVAVVMQAKYQYGIICEFYQLGATPDF